MQKHLDMMLSKQQSHQMPPFSRQSAAVAQLGGGATAALSSQRSCSPRMLRYAQVWLMCVSEGI